MSERGAPIPWASLAAVAAFVAGTLLVPKAFDLLRPAEKERAQPFSDSELEVDARLWEDPFAAVRRHEAERLERCKGAASSAPKRECDAAWQRERRRPSTLRAHLEGTDSIDGTNEVDSQTTLVIAALVPGNPFVGAEESRRRTRFALLSGLQAEGYFPDSAEQIGLLQLKLKSIAPAQAASASAAFSDQLDVPYELLSRRRTVRTGEEHSAATRPAGSPERHYRRLAVVWVDEAALPTPKLDGLARLIDAVTQCRHLPCPRLAVLGPSSSDALNVALRGLEATYLEGPPDAVADPARAGGYGLLAGAHFYSPAATISEEDLPALGQTQLSLQDFLTSRFNSIVPGRQKLGEAERKVHFVRTIAPDVTVASLLAAEVLLRLPVHGTPRRVVTFVESDSIYARSLEVRFRKLLAKSDQIERIDQAYFFRGIDGVTVRDGAEQASHGAAKSGNGSTQVEWPEARDQLDYLRRLAEKLKRSEGAVGGGPIGAIGIFANDVHDKLLVLQALREIFPDKVFFTTDMDARYVHPRTLPFTRNLVVASSLPLQFPPRLVTTADGRQVPATRQVQEGTPPMRDIYQTATYLAARMASCLSHCGAWQKPAFDAIATPSVYEIGRSRAVAVNGFDAKAQGEQYPGGPTAVALAVGMIAILVGLLVWPSTPALRHARDRWPRQPPMPSRPVLLVPPARTRTSRMTSLLCGLYGLWAGFAAASLMEAAAPGSLGLGGTALWALLGVLAASLLSPGLTALAGPATSARQALGWQTLSLLLLIGLAGFAACAVEPAQGGHGEPLLWAEGISGWPSHFLHLLAVLAALVSADLYWHHADELKKSDAMWLGQSALPERAGTNGAGPRWLRAAGDWLRRHSMLGWRMPAAGSVEFTALWQRYQQFCLPWPRLLRVVFWTLFTVGLATLLFVVLTDRYIPEVPVRGAAHRGIVIVGLYVALLALPALVVMVADTTVAACRFLHALQRGRTLYPPDIVTRFARQLGAEHAALLAEPLAADPTQRDDGPAAQPHSLLDDWIDIQLVARETQAVAPLIVGPFVVLALLVVARSRLFDNWAMTWPIALTAAAYLLWLVGLAVALKVMAERLRSDALARMQADLRWLGGAGRGRDKLIEPYKRLIAAVESNATGAFAPALDQPLVASLMVPLGGAGGLQLLDHLLLGK